MPEKPPTGPALRASDADRDRTLDVLRAAVGDGRLLPDEFEERADAALTARTLDALAELTADLGAPPSAAAAPAPVATPALPVRPAVPKVAIREKFTTVRREGRWQLPHRLVVRTAWSAVTLDLTKALRSGPELLIELRIRGGSVELILAPDMVLDADGVSARFGGVNVGPSPDDETPPALSVRLVGRIKYGGVSVRWQEPRR